ncbi:MAG: peptidoglycan DD-metalloendopeptidase family protein [Cyclobacteriaceae bacterium]
MQRKFIISTLSVLFVGCIAFYVLFIYEQGNTERILQRVNFDYPRVLDFPEIAIPEIPFKINSDSLKVVEKRIKYGDSFYRIMKSLRVERDKINQINRQISVKIDLANFQKGAPYTVYYDLEGAPIKMDYSIDEYNWLRLDFERVTARVIELPVEVKEGHIQGDIYGSLIGSLGNAGAPEDLADKVITLFAWEIDFKNLLAGDQFDIYYQEKLVNEKVVGSESILAARLRHNGQDHYAYYFEKDSISGYFDQEGRNLSHGPVKGAIVTSLFSRRRLHPVRRTYRAHKGMDFMADEGTPVLAMNKGKVVAARYHYGNGNYVKIEHSDELMTQYLHLSEIDSTIKEGAEVSAQQVIGYVGNTGLSSGPHLCLRVWYKGVQRDPLDYDFPRFPGIREQDSVAFNNLKQQYFQMNL